MPGTLPLLSSAADGIHATQDTQGPSLVNNTILNSEGPLTCSLNSAACWLLLPAPMAHALHQTAQILALLPPSCCLILICCRR